MAKKPAPAPKAPAQFRRFAIDPTPVSRPTRPASNSFKPIETDISRFKDNPKGLVSMLNGLPRLTMMNKGTAPQPEREAYNRSIMQLRQNIMAALSESGFKAAKAEKFLSDDPEFKLEPMSKDELNKRDLARQKSETEKAQTAMDKSQPSANTQASPAQPSSLTQTQASPSQVFLSNTAAGSNFLGTQPPRETKPSTSLNFFDQLREETKQQEASRAEYKARLEKDRLEKRGGNELAQYNEFKNKAQDLWGQSERAKQDGNNELAADLLKRYGDYKKQGEDYYNQYREKSGLAQAGRQKQTVERAQAWQKSIDKLLMYAENNPARRVEIEKEIEKMKTTPDGKFFQAVLSANNSFNWNELEKLTNDYQEELKKKPKYPTMPSPDGSHLGQGGWNTPRPTVIDQFRPQIQMSVARGPMAATQTMAASPLDKLDQITQGRDIFGNEIKTADMLVSGGVKLQKNQRADRGSNNFGGLQFRNIGGQTKVVGTNQPRNTKTPEPTLAMGQQQPDRSPATTKQTASATGMR
jgi:hypothetical protein